MTQMEINNTELVQLLGGEVDEVSFKGNNFQYDGYPFVEIVHDFGWVHLIWTGNQVFSIMDTNSGELEPGCTINVDEILDIVL